MANGLEVVSARLLDSLVCVDGRIARRASQVLAVLVRDVFALAVFITLCQSEVNDVNLIFRLVRSADQEVIGLDVTVDYSLLVHLLDAHQHLPGDEQDRLQIKGALAGLEEVLKGGPEKIHDHHVKILVRHTVVCPDVVEARNARFATQLVDELALPEQHDVLLVLRRFFNLGRVEFASLLLFHFKNLTESSASKLLDDLKTTF